MNKKNAKQSQKPRTSKLATTSLILVLSSICLFLPFFWFISFMESDSSLEQPNFVIPIAVAILCGLVASPYLGIGALWRIKQSNGLLVGKGRAITAIVVSGIIILGVVIPSITVSRPSRLVCASTFRGLSTSIKVYAYENDDRLPTARNWCDLFICHVDVDPKQFRCPESDAIEGESSYALNKNVIGMKLSEIPSDVVLMFETSFGRTEQGRTGRVKSREYFKFFVGPKPPEMYSQDEKKKGDEKVYIDRWNQVGGKEILTTEYHKGIGCNILFADCSAAFFKKEGLDTLRWEP